VLPEEVERWAALRTAARWEKNVAELLAPAGVPVFLPLMTRVTQYRSKRQSFRVPVFPGYVFCSESAFVDNPRVSTAARRKIAQFLRPPDHARLKAELRAVAELLAHHRLVQERLYGRPGEVVRITGGPLSGYEGSILQYRPNARQLILEVSFLGARLEVELDEHFLKKA
jgi:transcription antitermination factor NusG